MAEGSTNAAVIKTKAKNDACIAGIVGLGKKCSKIEPANQSGALQGVKLLEKPAQQLHVFLNTKALGRALPAGFA